MRRSRCWGPRIARVHAQSSWREIGFKMYSFRYNISCSEALSFSPFLKLDSAGLVSMTVDVPSVASARNTTE
jgi:hypothetical protein